MPVLIPRWLLSRLIELYEKFKTKEFSFKEAWNALNDDSRVLAIVLSDLNKAGWINIKSDPSDSRKKLYSLKHTDVIEKMKQIDIYLSPFGRIDLKNAIIGRKRDGKTTTLFLNKKKDELKKLRGKSFKETA